MAEKTLHSYMDMVISDHPVKIILSNKTHRDYSFRKVTLNASGDIWRAEILSDTQAFHNSIGKNDLAEYLYKFFPENLSQLDAWGESGEHHIKLSKKGQPLYSKSKSIAPVREQALHNRRKARPLPEGIIIPPLVDMGVQTQSGGIIPSMQDKWRQINRFLEIIHDAVDKDTSEELSIIDFGCGKSYLTFIVYYYFTEVLHRKIKILGIDLKSEVISACAEAAEKYNYSGMEFCMGNIQGFNPKRSIDMVISLHACDTATDHAIYNAIKWNAKYIFSAPCCQHELNAQIQTAGLGILTRYGLLRERAAALMTDAIRANMLEYMGYKTQILEFIGIDNTPKNLLIRAVRANTPQAQKQKALAQVENLMREFNLNPAIYRLLINAEKD